MFKKFQFQNFKKERGFTIIELAIAIFILFIAIFGVYNAFSTIVVLTAEVSNRLTATYLAQEGVEVIRNMRDNNWINDAAWNNGLGSCASPGCEADYTTGTSISNPKILSPWVGVEPSGTSEGGGSFLKLNINGFYDYSATGSATKFKRKITITSLDNYLTNMKVNVKVFWNQKGDWSQNVVEAEEYLYNWYEN